MSECAQSPCLEVRAPRLILREPLTTSAGCRNSLCFPEGPKCSASEPLSSASLPQRLGSMSWWPRLLVCGHPTTTHSPTLEGGQVSPMVSASMSLGLHFVEERPGDRTFSEVCGRGKEGLHRPPGVSSSRDPRPCHLHSQLVPTVSWSPG